MRGVEIIQGKPNRISYDWDNIVPVNKSPHFMNKIKYITTLFPESKIILVIRDIFAHSSSQKVHFDIANKKKAYKLDFINYKYLITFFVAIITFIITFVMPKMGFLYIDMLVKATLCVFVFGILIFVTKVLKDVNSMVIRLLKEIN